MVGPTSLWNLVQLSVPTLWLHRTNPHHNTMWVTPSFTSIHENNAVLRTERRIACTQHWWRRSRWKTGADQSREAYFSFLFFLFNNEGNLVIMNNWTGGASEWSMLETSISTCMWPNRFILAWTLQWQ